MLTDVQGKGEQKFRLTIKCANTAFACACVECVASAMIRVRMVLKSIFQENEGSRLGQPVSGGYV